LTGHNPWPRIFRPDSIPLARNSQQQQKKEEKATDGEIISGLGASDQNYRAWYNDVAPSACAENVQPVARRFRRPLCHPCVPPIPIR